MTSMNPSRVAPIALVGLLALVAVCADDPTVPAGQGPADGGLASGTIEAQGVRWRARVDVLESFPVQLAGRLTVENPGPEPVTVVFPDGCVALLSASDAEGREVWDQADGVACTLALVTVELGPGEARQFDAPIASARDVLGRELPDGRYRLAVYARPEGDRIELDVGEVDLAIPR